MDANKAVAKNTTYYPKQIAIVEEFAKNDGRKFSNAVQFIIEDWARLTDQRLASASKKTQRREVAR